MIITCAGGVACGGPSFLRKAFHDTIDDRFGVLLGEGGTFFAALALVRRVLLVLLIRSRMTLSLEYRVDLDCEISASSFQNLTCH